MRKFNSTQTGSAKSADYHIKFMGGQYRVFDKQGRFRVGFATLPAAQTYIDLRTPPASRPSPLATRPEATRAA